MKVVLNHAGIVNLLRSDAIAADLERRAERIARQANSEMSGVGGPWQDFKVVSSVGRTRARSAVITTTVQAIRAESNRKTLTRAIQAAR